jgi:peroxiredoxin Q/BCP
MGERRGAVRVGDVAPDFTLPSQGGEPVRLYDLLERGPVVLYFYPKDETPGCTTEACGFRDAYQAFQGAGAEVVGVSSDSTASHQAFADHHGLPFLLLSDRGGALRKRYGVASTMGIIPGRVTYVIDRDRTVRHLFSSQMNAQQHVREALAIVDQLAAARGEAG